MSEAYSQMSNDELRQKLIENGIPFGPIGATTRKVYEKKLQNLLENGGGQNREEHLAANEENGVQNGNNSGGLNVSASGPPVVDQPLIDFSNDAGRSPSREVSPFNNGGGAAIVSGGHHEGSARSGAENEDSDNEDDNTSESARLLTPDEMRSFRAQFSSNGSSSSPYQRRRTTDRHSTSAAKTPPSQPKSSIKKSGWKRVVPALLIALVMFTTVGIFVFLAFGTEEMHRAVNRWDFPALYSSLEKAVGRVFTENVFGGGKFGEGGKGGGSGGATTPSNPSATQTKVHPAGDAGK